MVNLHNAEQVIERERKHEFAKFQVKMAMTADQIREAVYESEYELARDNKDWLYDLVVSYYKNQSLSDEEYLDIYMDNVYTYDGDTLQNQLEEDTTNGTNK
jgi:hypothetical protein